VDDAAGWVTHTQAVGTAVYRLQANVRDAESAAYTLSKGIDTPEVRDRYARAEQIKPVLRELEQLLQDNPRQLVRVGRIESVLEQRTALVHGIATTSDPVAQRTLLEEMAVRYPIRGLIEELQAEEQHLLKERSAIAERQQRLANMVSWTALALQLALLVLTCGF
jgi:CHASE3 domain.